MGRCIYGGIYDPGNSLSDSNGYRLDVLEALRELDIPVIRYPGGNFIATYHWQDGIGSRENRPARPELAWLGTETNQFGKIFIPLNIPRLRRVLCHGISLALVVWQLEY